MQTFELIYTWLLEHQLLVGIISAVMFFGTLAAIPFLVVYIPENYFVAKHKRRVKYKHPLIQLCLLFIKNSLGVVLITAGLLMLVLPGQGLLTILLGLLAMDLPRKYEIERNIIQRPAVHKTLNAMREKMGRRPLIINSGE